MFPKIPYDRYIIIQKAVIILITMHSLIKAYQRFDKTVDDYFTDNVGSAFPKGKLLELSLTGFYVVTFNIAFMLVLFLILSFFIVLFNNMSRQKMIEDISVIAEAAAAAAVKGAAAGVVAVADMGLDTLKTAAEGAINVASNDMVQSGLLGSLGIPGAADKLKALKQGGITGLVSETLGPEVTGLVNQGQDLLKQGTSIVGDIKGNAVDALTGVKEISGALNGDAVGALKKGVKGALEENATAALKGAEEITEALNGDPVDALKKGVTGDLEEKANAALTKGVEGITGDLEEKANAALTKGVEGITGDLKEKAQSMMKDLGMGIFKGGAHTEQAGGGFFGSSAPAEPDDSDEYQDGPPPKPCQETDVDYLCRDSIFWRIESLFRFFYNSLYSYWVILCVGYSIAHYIIFRMLIGMVQDSTQLYKKEHLKCINFYFVMTYAVGVFSILYKL